MMPANDGQGFFDDVTGALASDLQMGNLEQALTDETDSSKCGPAGNGNECYQFRLPPQYATLLSQAGFKVINQANNHAYDFGPQGYANTKATLQANGITQLGDPAPTPCSTSRARRWPSSASRPTTPTTTSTTSRPTSNW